jgi:hypothetical protein
MEFDDASGQRDGFYIICQLEHDYLISFAGLCTGLVIREDERRNG